MSETWYDALRRQWKPRTVRLWAHLGQNGLWANGSSDAWACLDLVLVVRGERVERAQKRAQLRDRAHGRADVLDLTITLTEPSPRLREVRGRTVQPTVRSPSAPASMTELRTGEIALAVMDRLSMDR